MAIKKEHRTRNHIQLGGIAMYDNSKYFFFAPSESAPDSVQRFRGMGIGQQMTDGTFDFVAKPRQRSQSQLIKKMAHGRVSKTKDGAILLTLKIFCTEDVNISNTLARESEEAVNAVVNYQLKH